MPAVHGDCKVNPTIQGSYGPSTEEKPVYEKKCMTPCVSLLDTRCHAATLPHCHTSTLTQLPVEPETAPSGMLARGHYTAISKFVDDDNHVHLQFKWSFDIKKDWK